MLFYRYIIMATETETKSYFETFLENWIDNDRLSIVLTLHGNASVLTKAVAGICTSLPSGIPSFIPLNDILLKGGITDEKPKNEILSNFKDILMTYIIYVFKYYGFDFTLKDIIKSGKRIFIIDEMNQSNLLLAYRLKKIYGILTQYIIGGPDLSNKASRIQMRSDYNIQTPHREIFKLTETPTWLDYFGIKRRQRSLSGDDIEECELSRVRTHSEGGTRRKRKYNRGKSQKIFTTKKSLL